jgi:hypothetical protein
LIFPLFQAVFESLGYCLCLFKCQNKNFNILREFSKDNV